MGAVQRLATVVIIGLVALSTILVLYAADEPNRIDQAVVLQQDAEIQRATANYIQYCLQCHGPAGEGFMEGTGRVGMPLGGNTYATALNQQGIDAQGTPVSGGVEGRHDILLKTIHNGRGNIMPAWGQENGGQLNNEQILELVTMIQHVDWNTVYNEAIKVSGGYPTVVPTAAATEAAAAPAQTAAPSGDQAAAGGVNLQISEVDIAFDKTTLEGPSDTEFTITVTNNGQSQHDFVIQDLGVKTKLLNPGESETVTVNAPAGSYEYHCSVPGHKEAGMTGTLTLSPGGGPAPAAAPADQTGGASTPTEGAPAGEAAGATNLAVSEVDIAFEQKELSGPANTDITITVTNNGQAQHDFVIQDLGVQTPLLNPGESATVTVNAPAGSYEYHCSVPGHKEAGMSGTLTLS